MQGNEDVPGTEPLPETRETSRERRLRRRLALERRQRARDEAYRRSHLTIPEEDAPRPVAPKKKRRQKKKRSNLNWQEAGWVTPTQGQEEDEPMGYAQPVTWHQPNDYPQEVQWVHPPFNPGPYRDDWAERQHAQYLWDQHRALQLEEEARNLRNRWANGGP